MKGEFFQQINEWLSTESNDIFFDRFWQLSVNLIRLDWVCVCTGLCMCECVSSSKSYYKSSRSLAHIQRTMCKPKFSIKWTKRSVVIVWLCAVETDQYMYTSTDTDDRVILSVPVLIHTDCVINENTWKFNNTE